MSWEILVFIFYFGTSPETGEPHAYIGEAEELSNRLKSRDHKEREFWVSVIVFVSKDENLTKAHVRYLERRILEEAKKVGRYSLDNSQIEWCKICQNQIGEDMEVIFSERIEQLLPVLGTDILVEVKATGKKKATEQILTYQPKGLLAKGERTEAGFVVFKGSTAAPNLRASAISGRSYVVNLSPRTNRRRYFNRKSMVF